MTRLRCLVRMHRWGPLQGDDKGALRVCSSCGKTKRYAGDGGAKGAGSNYGDVSDVGL